MNRSSILRRFVSSSPLLLLPLALGSMVLTQTCHAAKNPKPEKTFVFFPPAPDEPRIQFLTSFASDEQLSEIAGRRNFFRFVVGEDRMQKPIFKPYGVATLPGKVFVCDVDMGNISISDPAKRKMTFFTPTGNGSLAVPVGIAVDADGPRYVTDTKRKQVLVFNGDNYVEAIGKKDEMKPVGIALTKTRIYVTDLQNHCVRVYDKATRKELFTFPKGVVTDATGQLFSPTNLAIDSKGQVHVSDTGGFCVNVYDADGGFLRRIGQHGDAPGHFAMPKGVAVDREGRDYVVDASSQVIQIFDEQGRILMYFGDPTTDGPGSTSLPAGIAIDYDNVALFQSFAAPNFSLEYLIFVTNQTGRNKISVYGFGHKK